MPKGYLTIKVSAEGIVEVHAVGFGLFWLVLIGAALFFGLRKLYKLEKPDDENDEPEKTKKGKGKK